MSNRKRKIRSGFTMVELMAMLIIIGLLAAVVATNVIGKIDKARVTTTKSSLKVLHSAVLNFYIDTGYYPSEEAGLDDLVIEPGDITGWQKGGYLQTKEVPKDAWNEEFHYELAPDEETPFVIYSYGADKEEGGEGHNKDLYSDDAD
ncbi:MAG: type II secretion system major pseudopilin GspG [Planctomycetota bacterium]|jgi:general secretion pathway protein G